MTNYYPREDWMEWRPTRRGADATLDIEAPSDMPDGPCDVVSASVVAGRVLVTLRVLGVRSSNEDPPISGNAG